MSTSIILRKDWLIWLKKLPSKMVSSQRPALYHRCDQLPFDRFLRCLINSDLSALIIQGKPLEADIAEAWSNIYFEFVTLTDDPEVRYFAFLQRDITLLQHEIFTVETGLYLLSPVMMPFSIDHRDEIIESITKYGYKLKIDFLSDYSDALQVIEFKLAPKKQKLANKEKELKEYLLSKADHAVTMEYFTKILMRLSKHQGYAIRPGDIMTTEYVALLKDYVAFLELQSQTEEGKNA